MTNDWCFDLESEIYTIVKNQIKDAVIAKFPKARFTTSNDSDNAATFPTIYIHALESAEQFRVLSGDDINGLMFTMEVKITVDTYRDDVKWIMRYITDAFKQCGFGATALPVIVSDANMYYGVARFRRTLCKNDEIITL